MKISCTAIAVALLALVGSVASAVPAQADTSSDEVLAVVNPARAQYGASPLTWNADLYPSTKQYAEACRFEHSNSQGRYGENLYAGTGNVGFEDAMRAWMAEAELYDYDRPEFSPETGHFTQVVWKSSTRIAVGIASCPAGTIFAQPSTLVVARFTPPGNVIGQFAQNVGRPQG